jgi:large-conductance mechanosensitive channel
MRDITKHLKQFILGNNIIGTSAGVCIALAAKDTIQSMVNNIILPLLLIGIQKLNITYLKDYLPTSGTSNLDISSFIKNMVTFILVIFVSFVFIKFAFEYLLDVKNYPRNIEKVNHAKSII